MSDYDFDAVIRHLRSDGEIESVVVVTRDPLKSELDRAGWQIIKDRARGKVYLVLSIGEYGELIEYSERQPMGLTDIPIRDMSDQEFARYVDWIANGRMNHRPGVPVLSVMFADDLATLLIYTGRGEAYAYERSRVA